MANHAARLARLEGHILTRPEGAWTEAEAAAQRRLYIAIGMDPEAAARLHCAADVAAYLAATPVEEVLAQLDRLEAMVADAEAGTPGA